MKASGIFMLAVFGFFILMGVPRLHAEADFAKVDDSNEENYSDPSAFEGDSDSMPGERAPENLPMDDAPSDAGVAVN